MKECEEKLTQLYRDCAPLFVRVGAVVEPEAAAIADKFYTVMLSDKDSAQFLDHELVNQRLHASMQKWICSLFAPRDETQMQEFIEWQNQIGHVHARINVPVRQIAKGMRLIKSEISQLMLGSSHEREELANALIAVHELLDILTEMLNQSYLNDVMENERHSQALRMDVVNHNLAIECERLRSNLFDWQRQILLQVYRRGGEGKLHLPDIEHSPFGLWVIHKAELFFPNDPIVKKLLEHMERMDEQLEKLSEQRGDPRLLESGVEELNSLVNHASWLLSALVEQLLTIDSSRDPLTRLYNRRYLPIIMQRETEISIKHGMSYAVLFTDIDHFKKLNDDYGHDAGDQMLRRFAELLNSQIRSGDFIFRYGGEEFLIVMSDTDRQQAEQAAERIRQSVASTSHLLDSGTTLQVTTSIGAAMHDGHPDYQHVIKRADEALYQAKQEGRNRVVFALS